MITRQRGLALALFTVIIFLLLRHTATPSSTPALGSARAKLSQTHNSEQSSAHRTTTSSEDPPRKPSSGNARDRTPNQKPLTDIAALPLRQRLAYHFPYDQTSKFPGYIWQTWKTAASDAGFPEEYRPMEASWTDQHPDFVHEVLTDENARYVLRHLYSAVPDVIAAYEALPRPVLKADFFRYLILLARGGIYTDIDTFAIRPTVDWVPDHVPRSAFGLVIGIEADPDRPDWADWYSRRIQFCQWTIQAKPGHPVLREIVAAITEKTLERKTVGTLNHDEVHEVVEFTGPAVWTDIIFDYFNDPEYFEMSAAAIATVEAARKQGKGGKDGFAGRAGDLEHVTNETITWRDFTGMEKARKVGDVVVLPITGFSPGVGTMGAGNDDDEMAMVKHYFDGELCHNVLLSMGTGLTVLIAGTWKPESERHIGETDT